MREGGGYLGIFTSPHPFRRHVVLSWRSRGPKKRHLDACTKLCARPPGGAALPVEGQRLDLAVTWSSLPVLGVVERE